MATQPIDPNPDGSPAETPDQAPDEITPGQGDVDHPDSVPVEEPRMPDEIRPGQGDTDQPDAAPTEEPGADPGVSRRNGGDQASERHATYSDQRPSLLSTVRSMIRPPS